jgi:putative pyruvate formate lyase activating enzyme
LAFSIFPTLALYLLYVIINNRAMENNSILDLYKNCSLCPRACRVDRTKGKLGFCHAPSEIAIATYMVHRFEEPPISGCNGSGTIFFSFCTGRCIYCQNYLFSRGKRAKFISIKKLSEIMIELESRGCHNINLVTPTHYTPSIIEALTLARKNGLSVPIVYNTSGYEAMETLRLLDGYIDIYLPDAKYSDNELAREHCGFIDYFKYNLTALKEMYRQVGNLKTDAMGIATKGLIIRHLVLPGYLDNTKGVIENIYKIISNQVCLSLMNQYSPIKQVADHPFLKRRLQYEEYDKAKDILHSFKFDNGWIQQ